MPAPSKVIVLDPDARAGRQVQLGFEREGVPAVIAPIPIDPSRFELPVADGDPGLVLVGGIDGPALDLVRRARAFLEANHVDAPIVFAGRGVRRTDAEAAGADEVVLQPAYLRDVVTIGRLLRDQPTGQRAHFVGSLAEMTGVFTLVRALSSLGRSAVLTLIRGLRRGEVRFYHGEVTSAQVGLIHGQAALHQLLLWTDARFDFHHEDVVRRQQIPMSHEELFTDAERFLAGVRDSSGKLSPSMVLEQDVARIQMLGKQIPTEVHGVLRMFDSHRVLADVLEDSPYRVFETLRVAQRALDVGLLRIASTPRPKATWRAVLAIEEWLVGADAREDVIDRTTAADSSGGMPAARDSRPIKGSRRARKKRRANTPVAVTPVLRADGRPDIDWGALVPRTVGAEVGPLAGVVPAAHTSGEISLPRASTRDEPREKLEALMDTDKRHRIFPTDIGLEPSVVLEDTTAPVPTIPASRDDLDTAPQAAVPASRDEIDTAPQAPSKADELARAEAEARAEAAGALARAEAEAALAKADADAKADAERKHADAEAKLAQQQREREQAEAAERAAAQRERDELAEAARREDERLRNEAAAWAREQAAKSKSKLPETVVSEEAAELARRLAEAKRVEKPEPEPPPPPVVEAAPLPTSAADLVKQLIADESKPTQLPVPPAARTPERTIATPPVVVAETESATVLVRDAVTVTTTAETARLVAVPLTSVEPPSPLIATPITVPAAAPTRTAEPSEPLGAPVTTPVIDEPSDGVIREAIAAAETAPTQRRPPPGQIPVDDRPKSTTGELDDVTRPFIREPAVVVAEPSILVADVVAVQTMVSAVAVAQAAAPPTPDAATPAREAQVREVRRDATGAFSPIEEAFFRGGEDKSAPHVRQHVHHDTFEDLDADYQPVGFWDRLLGRKPPAK